MQRCLLTWVGSRATSPSCRPTSPPQWPCDTVAAPPPACFSSYAWQSRMDAIAVDWRGAFTERQVQALPHCGSGGSGRQLSGSTIRPASVFVWL